MIAGNELSDQEIERRLRMLRYSPDNRTPGAWRLEISIKYVAWLANLHWATLYRAITSGRISEKTREALSPVLILLKESST